MLRRLLRRLVTAWLQRSEVYAARSSAAAPPAPTKPHLPMESTVVQCASLVSKAARALPLHASTSADRLSHMQRSKIC